jgi:predicted ATPase/DNA-binding SARP family transcriptional activator
MEFRILGPLEARVGGEIVALGGARPRALLAVLLLHANEAVSAERLAVALWGEDASAGAVKTVQVHVSRVRQAFGDPELLVTTPAGYRLRVRPGEFDLHRFEALVADGRRALAAGEAERAAALLREALGLWRGPALGDLASAPFAPTEIARLEEQRLAAVEARMEADLAAGRHSELIAELRQLTSEHAWRERLHSQLMLALYREGRQAEALEAYRQARDVLVGELGIEPGGDLRQLQQAILAHDPVLDVPSATVTRAIDERPTLPVPPTALFGRETDLEAVLEMLGELRTRLVTLVGPGGVGKTRLAIEAARVLNLHFTDGARFVALASVSEPRELAATIARALAVPIGEGESSAAAVQRFLRDRRLLLVLDNFEQVVAGAPLVSELLSACPDLTALVTSREPTRLEAERIFAVRPLAVPTAPAPVLAARLRSYGAVAMFVDRARARDHDFALSDANAAAVAKVCRRLDGLPLALELAAARIELLSPVELAARLDRALPLLVSGARDAPHRQRTLRATIDWSYGLLSDSERRAFARMAVFAGGAPVDAAETVTEATVLTLESLVSKQLLTRRDGRVVMLETVREYALERLADDPDRDALHHRFAAWCLDFAREAAPHLVRADRAPWLARIDAELPNLLAALSWTTEHGHAAQALRLGSALGYYWRHTNRLDDGLPWVTAALELAPGAARHDRASALLARARVTNVSDEQSLREYRESLEAGFDLFRACGDDAGMSACLAHLVPAEVSVGRTKRARALSDEAIRLAERSGDRWAVALARAFGLAVATDYEDCARRSRLAVPDARRVGDLKAVALMCRGTAGEAIAERRYREALGWLEQGLRAARELGDPAPLLWLGCNLGLARLFLDELDESEAAYREALEHWRDVGWEDEVLGERLLSLAALAARRGDSERAARLEGAATRYRAFARSPSEDTVWSRLCDEILAPAREQSPTEWDSAVREGEFLTTPELLDLAIPGGPAADAT